MNEVNAFRMLDLLREIRWMLILICIITFLEKGALIWEICHKIWIANKVQIVCPPSDKNPGTYL